MHTIEEARKAIEEYETAHRHPSRPAFDVSSLYDLKAASPPDTPTNPQWPNEWPHARQRGVYLILDAKQQILYIGKVSLNNTFGSRLGAYFQYKDDSSCRILGKWSGDPHFVITIAVPEDSPFEAPALEEFLITSFQPPNNSNGKRPLRGDPLLTEE